MRGSDHAHRGVHGREALDDDAVVVHGHRHELQPEQLRGPPRVDLPGILHRDAHLAAPLPAPAGQVPDHLERQPLALREAVRDHDVAGRCTRRANAVEVARQGRSKLDRAPAIDVAESLGRGFVQHALE